jgi:hypothetical protein
MGNRKKPGVGRLKRWSQESASPGYSIAILRSSVQYVESLSNLSSSWLSHASF